MGPLLTHKTILITGGTSRLGRAFVRRALQAGAKIFLSYFEETEEARTLAEAGAVCDQVDLSSTASIDQWVASVKSQTKSLDVLIHNAAAVRDHTLQNLTEEDWDYVLSVNLKAPYYLTKKLLPFFLKRRKDGTGMPQKIFMVTSRAALTGGFGISNYSASKAGLVALMKSLAQELGKRNVLVNAVNPGFMKSKMTEHLPPGVWEAHLAASPLNQISNPEEVADFLVYLCSDRMSQVTGQFFHYESRKI